MKIYNCNTKDGFTLTKCKRPSFKCCFGRTWDVYDSIKLDGEEIELYLDTTWGFFFYFEIEKQWYKVRILSHPFKEPINTTNLVDLIDNNHKNFKVA